VRRFLTKLASVAFVTLVLTMAIAGCGSNVSGQSSAPPAANSGEAPKGPAVDAGSGGAQTAAPKASTQ
jgi:hypothetical protein